MILWSEGVDMGYSWKQAGYYDVKDVEYIGFLF